MIPKEIEAHDLLVEAPISGWKLEVMSTNWPGYWIIQLSQEGSHPLALLIRLDNLAGICCAMRSCIDTANNPEGYSRAKTMFVTAASNLPTPSNDKGAVTVMSEWSAEPIMVLSYYRGGHGEGNVIRQELALDDAMRLSDMFATVYSRFPDKQTWEPRE